MIRGRFLRSGDDIGEILALRRRVFVDELGFPEGCIRDELDDMAIYALVFDEQDQPSGTGRIAIDDDRIMLGRICVLASARGQHLGDLVMRMLLVRAKEMEVPSVYIKALRPAVTFYQRYGFRPVGEPFEEGGATRQLLRALADEIDIEGECHKQAAGCAGCGKACESQKCP